MTSWIGLSLLILLSANAVLSQETYNDALIDNDPYLSKCIISTAKNGNQDGDKKIHSGPDCKLKTKIQFKVDSTRPDYDVTNTQGSQLVEPAKIKYKFGNCPAILVEVEMDNGKVSYKIHEPNSNKVHASRGFEFFVKRPNSPQGMDTFSVTHTWTPYFSMQCNVFHKEAGSSDLLMDFEQEVEEGVPDLTLIWKVKDPNTGYFGKATAKKIIEPTTTPAVEKKFPWWIIGVAVGVALVLLVILLVVGYLCWRSRRASKLKEAEKSAKSAFGATTQQDQSLYAPSLMKVEQDAKPIDPRAASTIASVAQSPAPN